VWHCPVCAAKTSERRRIELQQIIEKHIEMGGSVYMTTYTISHKRYDDLQDLLQRFLEARRKAKAGRRGQSLKTDFQICGTVSVLEVTWSEANGWHPHVHELVFCMLPRMDEENYEATMRQA
jgi:Replication protein